MQDMKLTPAEIMKIDELCDKHPFGNTMVLDFARDTGAESAIYLMEEIIHENKVRKEKKMGEIAHAATFRQRSRQHKTDLKERMLKQKMENLAIEQENARVEHLEQVERDRADGFDPTDLKHLGNLVAQMGADGKASEAEVSIGLQFISSIAYEKASIEA